MPRHARKTFFSLAVVLLGFTVFTPTMLAGASLGSAFSFGGLLWVILVGSLILGGYVAMMGYVGAKTGLTTVVMARFSFGNRGSTLASLLLGGTQIGWYGVIIGTIGALTASAFGIESYAAKATIVLVTTMMVAPSRVGKPLAMGYKKKERPGPTTLPSEPKPMFWPITSPCSCGEA